MGSCGLGCLLEGHLQPGERAGGQQREWAHPQSPLHTESRCSSSLPQGSGQAQLPASVRSLLSPVCSSRGGDVGIVEKQSTERFQPFCP